MSPLVITILAVVTASSLLAWRFGGPPERFAAAAIMIGLMADAAYHLEFGPSGFDKVDPVHLVLDSAELAAMTWLALKANRTWPLWAAALQVICMSGHVAVTIEPGMRRAYWAITQLPQYGQLAALLLGTIAHRRRLRRIGEYRSWRVG
jgi:hypothetical protein